MVLKKLKIEFNHSSRWQKAAVIGMCVAVIVLGVRQAGIGKGAHYYRLLIQKNNTLKQNYATLKLIEKDVVLIQKNYDGLSKKFYQSTGPSLKVPLWIRELASPAIRVMSIRGITSVNRGEVYREETLQVTMTGSIEAFTQFLIRWQQAPFVGKITQLRISQSYDNSNSIDFVFSCITSPDGVLRTLAVPPVSVRKSQEKKLSVQGFWKGENTRALINSTLVGVGDYVDGYRVLTIDSAKKIVLLEKEGKETTLSLK